MEAAEVADTVASDRHVLEAARAGNEDAGRKLMADHGPSMLRVARHVVGRYGGADAEDIVQEAFIAALTTGALPDGDVGAWMRAIAARKALDTTRRVRRLGEVPLQELRETGDAGTPTETLIVRQALAKLSATDRAVLVLVDIEGRSMKDAAAVLSTTSVGTRLRAVRARRKLATLLRESRG
jgi:RNA polymerase sigma-70 factor (ECF subfamily)